MWERHGRPETPYDVEDIEQALGDHTGDREFARRFFDRFVRGSDVPDYGPLLERAGFVLRPVAEGRAWIGDPGFRRGPDGVELVDYTRIGTPLYEAGLDRGDVIVTIGGAPVRDAGDVDEVLRRHGAGDRIAVRYRTRGGARDTTLEIGADPDLEVVTFEAAGREVAEAVRAFRSRWLGSQADRRGEGS